LDLHFPKLITGGSLESLLYAYMTETPIVITQPYVPFELEVMEETSILELLGYERTTEVKRVEVWDRLSFILSMGGFVLMPNNVRTIKHLDKQIVFTMKDNTRMKIGYDTLISFDKHLEQELKVYDWFSIRSGSKVELDEILDHDNLVKKIIFYPCQRRSAKGRGRKDLVSYSEIPQTDIHDYESSESYVRLKTLSMMKDAGLRGKANGYNSRGKAQFYAIKIEHTYREIHKTYKPKYNITELLSKFNKEKELWNLTRKLLHRKQISILRESSRLQVVV